jgi:hypothetical protein
VRNIASDLELDRQSDKCWSKSSQCPRVLFSLRVICLPVGGTARTIESLVPGLPLPVKQLTLGTDGTASLMPFVNKPDYLLSGTFDCIDGILHLRFTLPYCCGAGSESMFYQSKYDAHLEEDELVMSQTESFAGDCREPDFRCRKEPKARELPVTSCGLRVPPHAAWVWK